MFLLLLVLLGHAFLAKKAGATAAIHEGSGCIIASSDILVGTHRIGLHNRQNALKQKLPIVQRLQIISDLVPRSAFTARPGLGERERWTGTEHER